MHARGLHQQFDVGVTIVRPYNGYGPRDNFSDETSHVIPALIKRADQSVDVFTVWGDGQQTRSFLYIDECLEGVRRLMESDFIGPVNIGSDEMVSINQLAEIAMEIAGKKLRINHIDGPLGVRGRNSDNRLIQEKLGWAPNWSLHKGMELTYKWIAEQVDKNN